MTVPGSDHQEPRNNSALSARKGPSRLRSKQAGRARACCSRLHSRGLLRRGLVLVAGVAATACGGISIDDRPRPDGGFALSGSERDGGSSTRIVVDQLPQTLEETGLYKDIEKKELADCAREYQPGVTLWSDGLTKRRWVCLPEGEKIDNSSPDDWKFPVGTRFWKEFSFEGKRIETRIFWKTDTNWWEKSSYRWNEDQTSAEQGTGEIVRLDGFEAGTHDIPKRRDCDTCHKGSRDRVLGFEQVSLGWPSAEGLTLEDLVDEDLLTDPPRRTESAIGTRDAEAALSYLHVNCGVSCHNDNTRSEAYGTTLRMKLKWEEVDGSDPSDDWEVIDLLVGEDAHEPQFTGSVRVVPGDPDQSLVTTLMSRRGEDMGQMPPLGSKLVDEDGLGVVEDWIRGL